MYILNHKSIHCFPFSSTKAFKLQKEILQPEKPCCGLCLCIATMYTTAAEHWKDLFHRGFKPSQGQHAKDIYSKIKHAVISPHTQLVEKDRRPLFKSVMGMSGVQLSITSKCF